MSVGGCFGKTAADCDDKDPKTVDACSPSKGCIHVKFAGGGA